MKESRLLATAAAAMTEAGFFVQREVTIDTVGQRRVHLDLIGWAATDDGELVPDVIVEVKALHTAEQLAAATQQLGYYLPLVGAARAFVYSGEWHVVEPGLVVAVRAEPPRPSRPAISARAPEQLLRQLAWRAMDELRSLSTRVESWRSLLDAISSDASHRTGSALDLARLAQNRANGATIARIVMELAERFDGSKPTTENATADLSAAMVRLLDPHDGWTVCDPYCGLGAVLLAAHEFCAASGINCRLMGYERSRESLARAEQLLSLTGAPVDIRQADIAFEPVLANIQSVVARLAIGSTLPEPQALGLGGTTRDGEIVALDRIFGALQRGGRAVTLVSPRLLFAGGGIGQFRAALGERARIVSVIELPGGLLPGTRIHCAILVFENGPASETLVAKLTADWRAQLAPGGAFLSEYLRHLRAPS